jgi:glutathione S-transferase
MYAPVAARFVTYAVDLDEPLRAYVERIWSLPAMLEWRSAAEAETEFIEEDEPYR